MTSLSFFRDNLRFLSFGLMLMFCSNFGQTFYISLFGQHLRDDFGLSHAGFGSLYSMATLASAFMLAWVGRRIDVVDLRFYTVLIGIGLAGAAFGMWLATSVLALGLSIFGLRFCGQGLMTHASVTSMARYFETGRGRAMSFAGLGMPLGEAVFPLGMVAVIAAFGWRQTWAISGAVILVLLIPLMLWLLKGHKRRHQELLRKNTDPLHGEDKDQERQWTRRQVLADVRFYLVLPGVLMPPFLLTGFFFHQVALATSKGWTLSWLATAFVGYAIFHILSSVTSGFLVDHYGGRKLLTLYQLPLAFGLLALAMTDAPWVALFYLSMASITTGASLPVVNAMWTEVYGVRHIGAIKAMTSSLMVFSTAISPIAMGYLLDMGWTMNTLAYVAVGFVSSAMGLFLVRRGMD